MQIFVNNQPYIIDEGETLNVLIERFKPEYLSQKGVAIAVNNEVIPKAAWESFKLKEQDKVVIIRAVRGG